MGLSDYVTAHIRTVTPMLVGFLATWALSTAHIAIDPSTKDALAAALATGLSAGWYALVRVLEKRWPQAGWLLGVPAKPVYLTPPNAPKEG